MKSLRCLLFASPITFPPPPSAHSHAALTPPRAAARCRQYWVLAASQSPHAGLLPRAGCLQRATSNPDTELFSLISLPEQCLLGFLTPEKSQELPTCQWHQTEKRTIPPPGEKRALLTAELPALMQESPTLKDLQTWLIIFPSLLPGFTKIPDGDLTPI